MGIESYHIPPDCSQNAGLYLYCSGNPAVHWILVGIPGGELSTVTFENPDLHGGNRQNEDGHEV